MNEALIIQISACTFAYPATHPERPGTGELFVYAIRADSRDTRLFHNCIRKGTPMVNPIMNLDAVEFDDIEENGPFTSSRGQISDHIGARKLGYNLTVLPPGKVQCPFHCHHNDEEMFLIIEGEGELRFGDKRYPIRKHDVIACPPGGPEVAHQIINTGATTMRYLSLSTLSEVETCEYPDSQKILIVAGRRGARDVRKLFRSENTVDYYDREPLAAKGSG